MIIDAWLLHFEQLQKNDCKVQVLLHSILQLLLIAFALLILNTFRPNLDRSDKKSLAKSYNANNDPYKRITTQSKVNHISRFCQQMKLHPLPLYPFTLLQCGLPSFGRTQLISSSTQSSGSSESVSENG